MTIAFRKGYSLGPPEDGVFGSCCSSPPGDSATARAMVRSVTAAAQRRCSIRTPAGSWRTPELRGTGRRPGRTTVRPVPSDTYEVRHERGGRATATGSSAPVITVGVLGVLFLVGILAPAREFSGNPADYLILHMAAQFASIAIALMVFALSLHLRGEHSSRSLSILGAACMSVALIDFAHLLSYAGMPFWVTESSPEKAINFWLPARAIMAAALLLVAILPERRIGRAGRWGLPLAGAGIALAVYWVVLFHSDWLPRTFIEGEGLTTFKVAAEYVIAGVCVAAGVLMWRRSARARDSLLAWQWLAAAAFTAAMSELFFTLYSSVTDTANLLGHLYKVAAFLMIYRAVFAQGIDRPQRDLARERGLLRTVVDSVPDQIQLQDQQGATVLENRAHPIALDSTGDAPGDWTDGRALPLRQESETGPDGQERTYDVVEANAMSESGDPIGTVVVRRDITEVVEYHRRLERLSNFDPITGLANQNALLSDLSQRCRDGGEPFCLARVFVTDLSGVEAAESSLVRDEAAVQIAQRIRAAADPDCVTARLGTSEFAVVAPAATHHAAADLAYPPHWTRPRGAICCRRGSGSPSTRPMRTAPRRCSRPPPQLWGRRSSPPGPPCNSSRARSSSGRPSGPASWRICGGRWTGTNCSCTTSPRSTCGTAPTWGSRRWSGGSIPNSACCRPTDSSTSPNGAG